MRGILASAARGSLITGETVTANYFDLLGIPIELGRGFRDDENLHADGAPVIIVSHGLWQRTPRRLAGRRSAQTVKISGLDYTVVGVASREFGGAFPASPPTSGCR